jgi:phage repressor protein C with HTH and peptisase S24 domain
MDVYADFLRMIEAGIEKCGNANKLAEILNVNANLITRWRNKDRVPSLTSIQPLIDFLGVQWSYPSATSNSPKNPEIRRVSSHAPTEKVQGKNLQELSVYDVAGAGPAIDLAELTPLFSVYAPPNYLRQADFAILIDGHSMEPLIPHRSVVGVKKNGPFVANELYAARIPYEGMVVKRIGVDRQANEFVFKSDNPNKEFYPDFRLNISEAEQIIVGRVVWVMWGY